MITARIEFIQLQKRTTMQPINLHLSLKQLSGSGILFFFSVFLSYAQPDGQKINQFASQSQPAINTQDRPVAITQDRNAVITQDRHAAIAEDRPAANTQDRPNYSANKHIIEDTVSAIRIQVVEENQVREVQQPLATFQLRGNENMAVIENSSKPGSFESRGTVEKDGQRENLKGFVLPEIYIARVKQIEVVNDSIDVIAPLHPEFLSNHPDVIASQPEQVILQVLVDTMPVLEYNRLSNRYEGIFSVALVDDSRVNMTSLELEDPVPLQFSSARAEFEPSIESVNHTNRYNTIRIADRSDDNPVPVKIITNFNMEGYITHLAKMPALRIETPSRTLQGNGVQAIPIRVSLHAYTGSDSVMVNLDTNLGSIEPGHVYLKRDVPGTVMLKSEGAGHAVVSATAFGFTPDEREYIYVFPWVFIFVSVIGGFIGALVKYLMKQEKSRIVSALLLGCLTGFIVALLYWGLGLNVLNLELDRIYNEFAVMGLAILGALYWQTVYSGLSKMIAK